MRSVFAPVVCWLCKVSGKGNFLWARIALLGGLALVVVGVELTRAVGVSVVMLGVVWGLLIAVDLVQVARLEASVGGMTDAIPGGAWRAGLFFATGRACSLLLFVSNAALGALGVGHGAFSVSAAGFLLMACGQFWATWFHRPGGGLWSRIRAMVRRSMAVDGRAPEGASA
jgi:hypothetical protein